MFKVRRQPRARHAAVAGQRHVGRRETERAWRRCTAPPSVRRPLPSRALGRAPADRRVPRAQSGPNRPEPEPVRVHHHHHRHRIAAADGTPAGDGRRETAERLPEVQERGEEVLVHRAARPRGHLDRVVRFVLLRRQQRSRRARPVGLARLSRVDYRQSPKRSFVDESRDNRLRLVQNLHTPQVHGDARRYRYGHTLPEEIGIRGSRPQKAVNAILSSVELFFIVFIKID